MGTRPRQQSQKLSRSEFYLISTSFLMRKRKYLIFRETVELDSGTAVNNREMVESINDTADHFNDEETETMRILKKLFSINDKETVSHFNNEETEINEDSETNDKSINNEESESEMSQQRTINDVVVESINNKGSEKNVFINDNEENEVKTINNEDSEKNDKHINNEESEFVGDDEKV